MSNRITIEELQSYLWNSAVLLRSNIDAGAYKQYIFPLLFFKRICDVYDEETAAAVEKYGDDVDLFDEEELHTFIVPKGHHWNDVRVVAENVGVAIVNAFHAMDAETWMDANKAMELGFADGILKRGSDTEDMEIPVVSMMYSEASVVNSLKEKLAAKCRIASKTTEPTHKADDLMDRLNLIKNWR